MLFSDLICTIQKLHVRGIGQDRVKLTKKNIPKPLRIGTWTPMALLISAATTWHAEAQVKPETSGSQTYFVTKDSRRAAMSI